MAEPPSKRRAVKLLEEEDVVRLGIPSLQPTAEVEEEGNLRDLAEFLEAELLGLEDGEAQQTPSQTVLPQGGEPRFLLPPTSADWQGAPTYSGLVGLLPAELFIHILRYLSPEDLSSVARVCRFLKQQSGEDSLWRRGYCLRWGPPRTRPKGVAWKQLYYDRDRVDMQEFLRNCPEEFREAYIQMQAAKRSQPPRPDQIKDDLVVVESTIATEITAWRRERGLPEVYTGAHECSGSHCSFHQIDNVFLCDATGRAHVCDENCGETVLDPENQLLVCTVSGRCFDRWISAEEEEGEQVEQGRTGDDGEPLMGAGRLGRAYYAGYNCDDEEELRAFQRTMGCY